jgi:hypothetical protein
MTIINNYLINKNTYLALIAKIMFYSGLVGYGIYKVYAVSYDHDGNQFIASAVMLCRYQRLPYIDYPFFHNPYVVVLNSLVACLGDGLLLNVRGFTFVFWIFSFLLLLAILKRTSTEYQSNTKFFIGILVLTLVFDPSFDKVFGGAFNHAQPIFFSLIAAYLFFFRSTELSNPLRAFFIGGALGLAIGCRSSFAVLLLPFLYGVFKIFPGYKNLLSYFAGIFMAVLPMAVLAALSFKNFFFGNITYIQLNSTYRLLQHFPDAMSPLGKLTYFVKYLINSPTALFLYVGLFLSIAILIKHRKNQTSWTEPIVLYSSIFLLMVVGILPSPLWIQYFFAPIPFILIAIVRLFEGSSRRMRNLLFFIGVGALVFSFSSEMISVSKNLDPQKWDSTKIAQLSEQLKTLDGEGKILSLNPVIPLQAGFDTYTQFSASPFPWRVANLVPKAQRSSLNLVGPKELEELLQADPPLAILTGLENSTMFGLDGVGMKMEWPIRRYAKNNGYLSLKIEGSYKTIMLWTLK